MPSVETAPVPRFAGLRNALHGRVEVPLVTRALGLERGLRVLQVGCGDGVALAALARHLSPRSLTAVDLDETLLGSARRRGSSARLLVADVVALPFADASFDLVVDFGVCHHLPEATSAMSEISRVLAPGGTFVHETWLAQLVAHPRRRTGSRPSWRDGAGLVDGRRAGFWASHRKH